MSEASPVTDHAAPLVGVRDLWKHFGGVQALKGVELEIFPGEVHGLVGANGAGKSTLIKILAGLEQPDRGAIIIGGTPVQLRGAQHAAELGFSFIHQELNLVPHLNVLENIVLGAPKSTRCGLIDWRSVRAQVLPIANKVGITFSLDAPLARLSTAERWLVTICRALVRRTRLMVLDEATASLSIHEAENLFRIVRSLASEGVAILYVSHRLDEILDLCARVTAFRDGRRVLDAVRERFTRQQLVEAIVGGAAPAATPALDRVVDTRDVLLEVERLARGKAVRDVSLQLRRGEVLGLAGLVGSGRSELVRMIFGADRPDYGRMRLAGAPFAPNSPSDAMKAGIGLVPEERRSEGLILKKSVGFNLGLTVLSSLQAAPWLPLIRLQHRGRVARALSSRLRIKTPSVDTAVDRLSGGNQQKVVIGKWLAQRPKILILDEPTRGVDIGARAEIHQIIRELTTEGTSVIIISSEAEELPGLCDRVLVLAEGRIIKELNGGEITRDAVVYASYHSTEMKEGQ
jgi:ribose transport system ATP-binding protein